MRKIDYFILSFLGINFILSGINRKKSPEYLKFMPFLFLANLLIEVFADVLMHMPANNLFLYHILTPVQYFFLSGMFYINTPNRKIRRLITLSNVILVLFAFLFAVTIQPINQNNSYENILKNIFLLILIIIYFRGLLINDNYVDLGKSPIFFISSILFITTLGNITIDLMLNFLMKSKWANILYSSSLFLDLTVLIVFLFVYVRIGLKDNYK